MISSATVLWASTLRSMRRRSAGRLRVGTTKARRWLNPALTAGDVNATARLGLDEREQRFRQIVHEDRREVDVSEHGERTALRETAEHPVAERRSHTRPPPVEVRAHDEGIWILAKDGVFGLALRLGVHVARGQRVVLPAPRPLAVEEMIGRHMDEMSAERARQP